MKTNTNFLCIDDQNDDTISALLKRLESAGPISFHRITPSPIEQQLLIIDDFIRSQKSHFGILLDLRLDMDADSGGDRVSYRGPTLAQELRTRMTEGIIPAFPITLWSVNTKFKKSYEDDKSSHDLFDDVYEKDLDITNNPKTVTQKLISLAHGYTSLRQESASNCTTALKLKDTESSSSVYSHFIDEYEALCKAKKTHETATLILNGLIKEPGLLVSEDLLAARLGVDIPKSGSSWEDLKDIMRDLSYQGPFRDGWPRWWWFRVEDWWEELSEDSPVLRRASSEVRVSHLNKALNLELIAATPIEKHYSSKFDTLCAGTFKPLDSTDGLSVLNPTKKTWQDSQFVSIYAALERINRNKWRLDPLERERLALIKEERS